MGYAWINIFDINCILESGIQSKNKHVFSILEILHIIEFIYL
jgi:hypothetical protein